MYRNILHHLLNQLHFPPIEFKLAMPSAATAASQLVGDDDDFQDPYAPSQLALSTQRIASSKPLQPSNSSSRQPKKKLKSSLAFSGEENVPPSLAGKRFKRTPMVLSELSKASNLGAFHSLGESLNLSAAVNCSNMNGLDSFDGAASVSSDTSEGFDLDNPDSLEDISLDAIKPSIECTNLAEDEISSGVSEINEEKGLKLATISGYLQNSIESRLIAARAAFTEDPSQEFEVGDELDGLIRLCADEDPKDIVQGDDDLIHCPLCGVDISHLSEESRQVHTNDCLDEKEDQLDEIPAETDSGPSVALQMTKSPYVQSPGQVVDVSPVLGWLRSLGLERYEEAFVREEIDWDSLKWLTEEDIFNMGITALGPRKKIVHALNELRNDPEDYASEHVKKNIPREREGRASKATDSDASKSATSKLITDYFPGPTSGSHSHSRSASVSASEKKSHNSSAEQSKVTDKADSNRKVAATKRQKKETREIPKWCCIPGTPFRVDAFRYLRRDCSHWFLTHFHMDHYQGLTKSFCHGKIYCSEITAKLVNMKLGIPWDKLQVLPLNEKISIDGVDVTCIDANHCPGSIIILFEPPNGKAVLHTGDFRFCDEMAANPLLQACNVHTLILDTTYCQPQYDFPKQEAVIQFVLEAIQAEEFNPKTLFLIGSYTIGKERLYMEVGRALHKKVYIGAAKLRLLKCFGYAEQDMQWLTVNELESHIHVVPMWMLASLKRLKQVSNHYQRRFSLVVAISPTGWSFGKGKKGTGRRRWQQGTIIRYEVPYSEHSSFPELREFVKFVSPVNIIPSVNNDGPDSETTMISLLTSSSR